MTFPVPFVSVAACGPTVGTIFGSFKQQSIYGGYAGVLCSLTPQAGVSATMSHTSVFMPSKAWARVINDTFNFLNPVGFAAVGAADLMKWWIEPW